MVVNLGWVKDRKWDELLAEIRAVKAACKGKLLKVIIETCLLTEEEKIRLCGIVSESGAEFIKTSTGFGGGGATREDVALFKAHVAPHVRIKAAINLLQTTRLPVSDIDSRVGYQSLSSFNRHFLRIAGTSPLNYRRQRESGLDSAEAALLQSPEAQGYSPAECILSASGQQSFP